MTRDEQVGKGWQSIDPDATYRSQPVNPYIAGAPVSGAEMFYGRDDVFAFIQHKLIGQHQDTPIVLKGERRSGKTSVLYQVHRHLDQTYRCVTVDLHGLSLNGIADLLKGLATSISDSLLRDYNLSILPPGRDALEADPRAAFESVFLSAVLAALGQDHLVLMLDEVVRLDEEIRAGRLDRDVFSYLRHLIQHHPRLNFIFSLGSGLEEMQKDYAFMFSAAMYHQISFLEKPVAYKLITEPVRGHFEVLPDAVDTILMLTSGHPYYTQLVCHSLFDRWVSQAPKPTSMTADDVHAVLGEAIELGSPNLTFVWQDSTREEKAAMAAMAAAMRPGPHSVTSRAILRVGRKAGVPLSERNLSAALRSLASREIITRIEPYSFTVDLQRLWLDKHRPLPWLKDELAQEKPAYDSTPLLKRGKYIQRMIFATTAIALVAVIYFVTPLGNQAGNSATPGGNGTISAQNSDAINAAKQCLDQGAWTLSEITGVPINAHNYTDSFTGQSEFTFNANSSGSRVDDHLEVTTTYTNPSQDSNQWAPTLNDTNGSEEFQYDIQESGSGLELVFSQVTGTITQTNPDPHYSGNPPPRVKLATSSFNCSDDVLSITGDGEGDSDGAATYTYVISTS